MVEKQNLHFDPNKIFLRFAYYLQRISDLTVTGFYSFQNYTGPIYPEIIDVNQYTPYSNLRMKEEDFRKEFENYYIKNGIREYLEVFSILLNSINNFGAILKTREDYVKHNINRKINLEDTYWKFDKIPLKDKIDHLEKNYGFDIWCKDEILTINRLRNCLVHRLGYVAKKDCNSENKLKVKYLTFAPFAQDGNKLKEIEFGPSYSGKYLNEIIPKIELKIKNVEKEFEMKSKIEISLKEFFDFGFTFNKIGQFIMCDLNNYGYDTGAVKGKVEKSLDMPTGKMIFDIVE